MGVWLAAEDMLANMHEKKIILYGLRLWGVFFFVDGAYRFGQPIIDVAYRLINGHGAFPNWSSFWLLQDIARPTLEAVMGAYLLFGGFWLAALIVRSVESVDGRIS